MSRDQALAYISERQVMTLATSGDDGVWAAAVFYVNDRFDFYFLSAGHTRHAQHIARAPQVAATIQQQYVNWQDIKGVQMAGAVDLLEGNREAEAKARYQQRFPFLAKAGSGIAAALARVNWYRLRADRLYFIDNSRGLGHRERIL
jgi:uncharacterized protein YhbP (UPF0306 family)